MLKIGSLQLKHSFYQAPLSGYSDYAMRRIAVDCGCPLTFAGVVLAKSAMHPKLLRRKEFQPREDEHPVGAQILGTEPEMMVDAANGLVGIGYDLIDLNFACPAPKVLRRGRGGALLKDPDTVIKIFRSVRDAVKCPVTMKIRYGYEGSEEDKDKFWKICEMVSAEGIDCLGVHGRTVMQKYRGKADWQLLKQLKKEFPQTTIVGSGDLFEADDIVNKMKDSGIDGVIIARGAIGNPWLFSDLKEVFAGNPKPASPSLNEQGQVILKHFELVQEIYRPGKAARYFRKFLVNYSKRHPQRKKAQADFIAAKNEAELIPVIKHWYCLD
ncbi:MAG TPA: tRNA-dihydrouridine synthase family protein [Sedimentisphaerales bacterium]|nr:tRNA-dihydrouridine synthase family protein [Sedimentisphaerales bacterium]